MDLKFHDEKCETCCLAETTKTPVPKQNENKASKAGERVFTGVVGPITPSSVDGFPYFVTFIDDYSSHACVKFMRHKNQALQKFKEYIAENGTPRILRSDNGTEYTNKNFNHFCTNNKMKQEYNLPETPEQNGVSERYNRTVVETVRSLLIESKLPKFYWLRLVDTAAYIRNLVKKDKTDKNPHEKFWARKPKTGHLKVFGCLAYVNIRKREKSKFDPKAREHVFLGYDSNSTAYLLQDTETRKLTRARNLVFNERKVVSFTNEPREAEKDLLSDVTFEDQNEAGDSQNVVKIDLKEEGPEIEIKCEILVDEESSSSIEIENQIELRRSFTIGPEHEVGPDNQVESARNLTLTPESQAPPIPPRMSIGPNPPRPSKIPIPQERSQKASDGQQTSQVVKPKTKIPSKLDMAKQLVKIGLPSSTDKGVERWWENRDMQDTRREAKELKRGERSRNSPQRYGQSYSHNSTFFQKEPEIYKQAIGSSEKENWLQAMQEELKSLSDINTWTLVERPKDKNRIPGKCVYKVKTKADRSLEKYKAR